LFETRGPPLSHDLGLAQQIIDRLMAAGHGTRTPLPTFDKLSDDRLLPQEWRIFPGVPNGILLEGWCLAARPINEIDLRLPINDLERTLDGDSVWRQSWNRALVDDYTHFFQQFDAILYLAAPSFDVVLDWRCEQEEGLLGLARQTLPVERRAELVEFIAHYERLTRHMLAGNVGATAFVELDAARKIVTIKPSQKL
jgi:D-glycerate 3-kinase